MRALSADCRRILSEGEALGSRHRELWQSEKSIIDHVLFVLLSLAYSFSFFLSFMFLLLFVNDYVDLALCILLLLLLIWLPWLSFY